MTYENDPGPVAGKLKALRNKTGLSIRALAEAIGMPPSTYSSYENSFRKPHLPMDLVKRLLPVFTGHGIAETDLLALAGIDSTTLHAPLTDTAVRNLGHGHIIKTEDDEFARIPVFDASFPTGYGATDAEHLHPTRFYSMNMEMLRSISDAPVKYLMFVKVSGDSMAPLLSSGDWVMLDTRANALTVPAIYCFMNGGDAVIKHASQNLETGAVTLISENPLYAPQPVANPDKLRVVGRVAFIIRKT